MRDLWIVLANDLFLNLSLIGQIKIEPEEEKRNKYKVVAINLDGGHITICSGSKEGCQAKMQHLEKDVLDAIRV